VASNVSKGFGIKTSVKTKNDERSTVIRRKNKNVGKILKNTEKFLQKNLQIP
jgi:hypothetical protein